MSNAHLWRSHANPDTRSWALRSVCTLLFLNPSSDTRVFEAPYRSFYENIYLILSSEYLLSPIIHILSSCYGRPSSILPSFLPSVGANHGSFQCSS